MDQKQDSMDRAYTDNSTATPGGYNNITLPNIKDPNCQIFELCLYGLAMGLLCIVGFVGNTMSFLVLQRDRSTPVASFLLQSLAVADNIFLLLWFVHYSIKSVLKYVQHASAFWLYLRMYTFPIMYMAQIQTIWQTVIIALNRFMAVCLPYRAPHLCNIHNVYKEVCIVTLFSIAYNVPRFFELEITHDNSSDVPQWNRTALANSPVYETIYSDALYYLFSFILPLLILAFVNTRVIIVYRATQQRRQRMKSSVRRNTDNENNITLVMIMIVLIFMICQAPARIVQIIWNYEFDHCQQFQFYLIHISNTLEVLNSSVNFLIYCVFHKRFRDIMRQNFCCGPFSERFRRETRFTTTEGLSLEEVQRTASGSSKKGSSIKSSSQGNNPNGSIPYEKSTAVITMPNCDVPAEEAEKQPLNSEHTPKGNDKESLVDNATEPRDDVLEPLAP